MAGPRIPNDQGRYSLAQFSRRLGWLHVHAAEWSEIHIVTALLGDGDNYDAALAGLGPTLDRLLNAKPALAVDPRFIRLKTLWDQR